MYILRDYHDRIDRFICSRTSKAFRMAWVAVVLVLALLGAVFFWMGAPVSSGWPWDTMMLLDGAWRIFNGQTPHKDFYLICGELPIYAAWLGMKLGRSGISAIVWGNVFVMVGAGLAAMFLMRRRTSAFYACAFSLFVALLAVAPRALGDPYDCVGYAMSYNRCGEAILALMGAILFVQPEAALKKNWADWLEAGFAGFCLPSLLFCKLTYFLVGAAFFALACLRGRFRLNQVLFGLASAVAFFALALSLTHIPFSALYGDYRIMMAAQEPGTKLIYLVVQARRSIFSLLVLWLLVLEISKNPSGRSSAWPHYFLVAAIFGSEAALVATNHQKGEMPLLVLAAWYVAECIRRQAPQGAAPDMFITLRNLTAALLFLVFLLPTLGTDLEAIRHSAYDTLRGRYVTLETLQSTRLNDLRLPARDKQPRVMMEYAAYVNEGMRLLRRHDNPQMRLAVFSFSNPFHLALGRTPALGSVLCWSWASVTKRSHPALQRMIGNATHILTDRGHGEYLDFFGARYQDAYGAEWDALHLEVVEQTENFTLFKVPESGDNKR